LPFPHFKKTAPLEQGVNDRQSAKPQATPEPADVFWRVRVNESLCFKKGLAVFMRKQAKLCRVARSN